MIRKYKKKPVVIEALETNLYFDYKKIADFVGLENLLLSKGKLFIVTLEGNMEVALGDYVIKGVQGEFYPCKPDIFRATYELV
ncbi:hypothetical protein ABE25_17820 [Cytobacillus firmus]|uniref:hypothetical protein n=1 Tax=Cytobacillus firmus TaxID=1399 RepID=UPI0018CCFBD6|nr:hypothetical protein [Cytobacillus firmus]MBG9603942.1 hypothetical protein [Cytobacillus firmus]